MTSEEILTRLRDMQASFARRAEPARSGYIDPGHEDLAREEGQRSTYAEAADELLSLILEISPPVRPAI